MLPAPDGRIDATGYLKEKINIPPNRTPAWSLQICNAGQAEWRIIRKMGK